MFIVIVFIWKSVWGLKAMIFTILPKSRKLQKKGNGVSTMHIDMNKIEQMVQLFIKLNTDSQEKLMKKGYELLFTQKSKEELIESKEIKILGNGMLAKSDEQKIYQKTNKKIEHMENILELINTDDMHKEKATLIALMDLLSHGGMTEKYNIKIQIEYAHEDLQKYLESLFPDVNAGEVIDNARKFIMKEKGKSNV